MVTPETKDRLLSALRDNQSRFSLRVDEKVFSEIDIELTQSLIRQFEKRHFVTVLQTFTGSGLQRVRVEIEADDFLRNGGHLIEDQIINNELLKLELEIKKLEKEISVHTYNTILTSIGTIAGAFSAAHNK